MQHNNQKNKLHIIPKSPGLIITLLLFLVVEIVFSIAADRTRYSADDS